MSKGNHYDMKKPLYSFFYSSESLMSIIQYFGNNIYLA